MTEDLAKVIGRNIRAAREKLGVPQRELARRVGVSSACVSNWERGDGEIGAGNALAASRVLGVSLLWLLGVADDSDERYRAGWDDCASAVTAVLKQGGAAPAPPPSLPAFGLRDHRATGLGVGEPWVTARGRDLTEAWPELIESRAGIAAGDEVVRRDRPGDVWRVVGLVGEHGSLVVPQPEAGAGS
ncbi:helix-turn-helix transcriptional regulator [Actinocrinis sp.]|uniref:helix-turn-helix domain-containing protein n=1 Tax=Actinocrinis sp. TaxID=1920516 RepID=UPI002D50090F|nr:helix-turn-helix transcriptional regulator [Actinocrinis sp.]HZP54993.1 helix-turn-helix transcriptional regulator [Actinocrinis sp.]